MLLSKNIGEYAKNKDELYTYLSYILTQNIKNYLRRPTLQYIQAAMKRITREIHIKENFFILDFEGKIVETEEKSPNLYNPLECDYFHEAVQEQRCILTNPYPTRGSKDLVVTCAYPIYNDKGELFYVVCMHIPLKIAMVLNASSRHFRAFFDGNVVMYFSISFMLGLVALLLFVKSVSIFWSAIVNFNKFDIKQVFHPIILLTLALATIDLVKAIFEEEVLGKNSGNSHYAVHRTMIRFLGSIIIALAIESLMLVFKFSITEPSKIIYAVYLTVGVAFLLISLAIYIKFAHSVTNKKENNKN